MRIAIVRLSAMGDIINSAFILQFIKQAYPQARIDWFCEAAFAPLLAHHPDLHAVHAVELKKIKQTKSLTLLFQTIGQLRSLPRYDLVLDLQGLFKSALVARFLGNTRYGFDKHSARESLAACFYTHTVSIDYGQNSLWRTAFLVNQALSLAITPESITGKKPCLHYDAVPEVDALLGAQKNILFVVGSSQPYKNYPVSRIIETVAQLNAHVILIWGSAQEAQDAQAVHVACPQTVLAPKLSLNTLIALVSRVDLVIGNDTGPTHIAWAQNVPSITLFGATSPDKMMWQTPINVALASSSIKNPLKINKQDFSMGTIVPQTIATTAQRLLDASH